MEVSVVGMGGDREPEPAIVVQLGGNPDEGGFPIRPLMMSANK